MLLVKVQFLCGTYGIDRSAWCCWGLRYGREVGCCSGFYFLRRRHAEGVESQISSVGLITGDDDAGRVQEQERFGTRIVVFCCNLKTILSRQRSTQVDGLF